MKSNSVDSSSAGSLMKGSKASLAIDALKAIKLSVAASLEHTAHPVPPEVITNSGSSLNLKRWSMYLKDDDLKFANRDPLKTEFYLIDPSKTNVQDMFLNYWKPTPISHYSLICISLSGAIGITDFGLALLARKNISLNDLDLTGCTGLTDIGLREVGLNCKYLNSLIISSTSFVGTGLIAIAEGCPLLTKINISRCQYLQKYGLVKVFYSCKKLEAVNISYQREIGDNEVRVLAQNSPYLSSFLAKDTPYVSDQSIMLIAQHCPDLQTVDVSRTQLTFKITDASLLALSEACPAMRNLKLAGCEHITDVGLTWLSEGCKFLEEIDISGCHKVMDAGMRSLGQCHSLTSVDISKNKSISDIGISSLSVGCPKLKALYCDGLFLLSDPRLMAAGKKKSKPESWNNVVGIAALAQFSPGLETLHLAGCFQLNAGIQKYVSNLRSLRELNLTGCNQLSKIALIQLTEGCSALEDVNMSDCGEGVCNASVEALGNNCKQLRVVCLARCIGFSSIKSLCRCKLLTKLDLTGCLGIVDMSLLPLCDEESVPKLSHLSLVGIKSLTDQAVAWIAFGCKSIVLLSLRGTQVNSFTARAVKDSFPCSSLMQNDNFFGFWPLHRYEDRKLMQSYANMTKGLVKLQSFYRASRAREEYRLRLEHRVENKAALIIQCFFYCMLAKKETNRRRFIANTTHRAAVAITSIFRVGFAKKKVRIIRKKLYAKFQNRMATKIQTQWRVYCDKRLVRGMLQRRNRAAALRVAMATRIQSCLRRKFAWTRVERIRYMRRTRESMRGVKVCIISRCYRGYITRKKIRLMLEERKRHIALRLLSVKKIQRVVRLKNLVGVLHKRHQVKVRIQRSATKIQALVRSHLARLYLAEIFTAEQEILHERCALKIQGRWKIKRAYNLLRQLREERAELLRRQAWASTQFAKYYRARQARIYLQHLREEARLAELWRRELINWSAITIQSFFRGTRGRIRFEKLMRQKRGLWIELFDEAKQKRFFYSKLTGEIRWQMPADLLALIPRPKCDNCSYYEAYCECSFCQELFCQQCFGQVHYGGRRKDHDFRCLYDYYNNRIDYKEGVYPSKWPSEIIQDEVQGWMLRVAPIRNPTSTWGPWEVYESEVAVGDNKVESRRFYFNRETFEATYEPPPELQSAQPLVDYDDDKTLQWNPQDYTYAYEHPQLQEQAYDYGGEEVYPYNDSLSLGSTSAIEEVGSSYISEQHSGDY